MNAHPRPAPVSEKIYLRSRYPFAKTPSHPQPLALGTRTDQSLHPRLNLVGTVLFGEILDLVKLPWQAST